MATRSHQIAKVPARKPSQTGSVVGEVVIDEFRFFVVVGELGSKDAAGPSIEASPDEAARFVLKGRTCVVVAAVDQELPDLANLLTARELQIAVLVGQGHQTKRIAHQLRISEWTVSTHLRRIFAKVGVDNRAAMVCRCLPLIERSRVQRALGHLPQDAPEAKLSPRGPPSLAITVLSD
jgi:DNA-binding CsgD family transcriptional regulator